MDTIGLEENELTGELDMGFADRFRKARLEAGLSQVEIAEKLGVTRQAVNHLETGRSKSVSMEHLFMLAGILQVNPEWLATGKGGPRSGFMSFPASDEAQAIALAADRLDKDSLSALRDLIKNWRK